MSPFQNSLQSNTKSQRFDSVQSSIHRECRSFLKSTESPSDGNYYQSAVSLAQRSFSTESNANPPSQFFPKWWPRDATSVQNYIAFSDHIAHVIVPNVTYSSSGEDSKIVQLNCEDVIQWVLKAAKNRSNDSHVELLHKQQNNITEIDNRRYRIEQEWMEGESVSTPTCILDPAYRHNPSFLPPPRHKNHESHNVPDLIPIELLALGSVWHLPLSATSSTIDRFDPSHGIKPSRLTVGDWNKTVHSGDYFRVHFDPRRFVETHRWNWGCSIGEDVALDVDGAKPGVIVARDDDAGYIIIDKPPHVPVHARVDNLLENVASSVGRMLWMERKEALDVATDMDSSTKQKPPTSRATTESNRKQKTEQLVYVATPQRLDQNTSGLLVVATKKSFAAYFAKLLRMKTNDQLYNCRNEDKEDKTAFKSSTSCGIHKKYRCLVCIMQSPRPMIDEVETLKKYAREGSVIRHYLEPSIKAPKSFYPAIPEGVERPEYVLCSFLQSSSPVIFSPKAWAECLLRIATVINVCTVVGNRPSDKLANALWGEFGKPNECIGVAEVEVELLTGRTHQIRGQFAALGCPLVGDVQYGGAIPSTSAIRKEKRVGRAGSFLVSESLALQCSALEFLDPFSKPDSDTRYDTPRRSYEWNSFRLQHAFWTPFLKQYEAETSKLSPLEATLSLAEEARVCKRSEQLLIRSGDSTLPPRVSLSRGSNKYVVIRANNDSLECDELLFVKSASPEECGGLYHANVAEELLRQLNDLGFTASVVGGGRIDYMKTDDLSHAHVYGFSYAFGKGNHEMVASIIETNSDTVATFDNSDGIY
ncbi:hypothetical protein HJC23_004304 [Cyclotella cryptica]|uniref:Pseudouridine synthase RsuA/RluA-like domain-containing protein n=1 Tax=Cyclotella cryptica TaxID=29204 RepID=A0ABD3Q4D4_9STRA